MGWASGMPMPMWSVPPPRFGAYKTLIDSARDLTDLHALLAPMPLLLAGGKIDKPDKWIALNHLKSVNEILGYKNRIALTTRPDHAPVDSSNAVIADFLLFFLKYDGKVDSTSVSLEKKTKEIAQLKNNFHYQLYDIKGRICADFKGDFNIGIKTAGLSSGMYFVKINNIEQNKPFFDIYLHF
jgi:hypothetical protein